MNCFWLAVSLAVGRCKQRLNGILPTFRRLKRVTDEPRWWAVANCLIGLLWLVVGILLTDSAPARADEPFQIPPFQVPEGFVVELAAGPPLLRHPIMAGFDDQGRLYVAESAGENLKRADLEQKLPNFIRRLEDTDGDGRFDKSTIFADKLTFPQGALWYDGALYVASSGGIWRFRDTNKDGVADEREQLVSQFGYTGNAADIHGCFLGPNGRIYWCDGRHGHDIADGDGGTVSKGKAARIFSARPDGSDVRVHCGGGMDNPVEIDFLPEGEMVGTVNILLHKRGDCLVHWMHGGVYPRHDQPQVVAEFRRTGDLLPPIHDFGHVAVSGTCRYRGQQFGPEYRDNFFVTEFNTHKVKRAALRRDAATFRAEVTDFLHAASDDFHPTDVLEDADGSLLVVDTGGWFRIGCPTSQIAKPNILGAIYRVRKKDAPVPTDPRGKQIAWSEPDPPHFVELLAHESPAVRERATARLTRMAGGAAENAVVRALNNGLDKAKHRDHKLHIAWTLVRIGSDNTRESLRKMLADQDAGVRQVAAHGVGLIADTTMLEKLLELLSDESLAVRREAATTLGRLGNAEAVPALLQSLKADNDRMLEHALIYALIEINHRDSTVLGLADSSAKVRRGALIALDQMADGSLKQEEVGRLLDSSDAALQNTALDVISRRMGWGDQLVELATKLLAEPTLTAEQQTLVSGALLAFRHNAKVQMLVASTLDNDQLSLANRKLLLDVIGASGLKPLPPEWAKELTSVLETLPAQEVEMLRAIVAAMSATGDPQFDPQLLDVSRDAKIPQEIRVAALAAVTSRMKMLEPHDFTLLTASLAADISPMVRLAAARALAAARLSSPQLGELTKLVAKAGPLELGQLLTAFGNTMDVEIGKQLFQSLINAPGLNAAPLAQLQKLASNFPDDVQAVAKPLFAQLQVATEAQKKRLDDLEKMLEGGGVAAGRDVFFSRRSGCFACHRVGNEGGSVGPDLSTIGQRRTHRDLLEAVLYPSASLARGFETHSLTLQDGRVVTGLITRETIDVLYVRTADQTDVRIPRSEVDAMQPSPISIMPAGLENTMTTDQLRDLLAYLRSLK